MTGRRSAFDVRVADERSNGDGHRPNDERSIYV
jgi:hypothetical protein